MKATFLFQIYFSRCVFYVYVKMINILHVQVPCRAWLRKKEEEKTNARLPFIISWSTVLENDMSQALQTKC